MNKKKILFVIPEYSHGGTNKCLENLLLYMDYGKFNIYIYSLYEDGGKYYKEVFKPYTIKKSKLYNYAHDNYYTRKICGLWHKINKGAGFSWLYKKEAKWLQDKFNFDVVIAYQEGSATEFASYFENVKKIAWIHCIYSKMTSAGTTADINMYQKFNNIICVSKTSVKDFISKIPECKDKALFIYNPMNTGKIKSLSNDIINETSYNKEKSIFSIISVGRFASVKQFDRIPNIAFELQKLTNIPFKWYVIASGEESKNETIKKINRFNLHDIVILLGSKDNPYKYIAKSNVLVCTSSSESYPTVINEAKILHIPVISTNYPSANEIINDDFGVICSIDEMPNLLAKIINNEDGIYTKMKESISNYEYSNDDIIKEIEKILDN